MIVNNMNKIVFSDNDKIDIVDKIIKMIPEIKKKRTFIINQILTPKVSNQDHSEYILEKICVNGKYYYRDKNKCILNEKAELVGIWEWNYNSSNFNYYIFADEKAKINNYIL